MPYEDHLPLRDEPPLSDGTPVVRGGVMAYQPVAVSVEGAFEEFGLHLLSVFAREGWSALEVWNSTPELNRYGKIRISTAGELRDKGFVLLPTFDAPHYDLVLPGPLSLDIWGVLDHSFQQPITPS
jgi:hypothetical protein